MWQSWAEAREEARRPYKRGIDRRVLKDANCGRDGRLTGPSLALRGWLVRRYANWVRDG
jgi:hypothetical protein